MHPLGSPNLTKNAQIPGLYQSSCHAHPRAAFYLSHLLPFKHPPECITSDCRSALTVLPRPVFHAHHARFCTLPTRRSASPSLSRARAGTFAQCSGLQVRQLAKTAASGGCVDVDVGDECCIRSCACKGYMVDGSAQRGALWSYSRSCRERGFVRWGCIYWCVVDSVLLVVRGGGPTWETVLHSRSLVSR
jgi:hypothetical protein